MQLHHPPTQAWMFLLSYSLVLPDRVVMCLKFVQRSIDYARGVAITAIPDLTGLRLVVSGTK